MRAPCAAQDSDYPVMLLKSLIRRGASRKNVVLRTLPSVRHPAAGLQALLPSGLPMVTACGFRACPSPFDTGGDGKAGRNAYLRDAPTRCGPSSANLLNKGAPSAPPRTTFEEERPEPCLKALCSNNVLGMTVNENGHISLALGHARVSGSGTCLKMFGGRFITAILRCDRAGSCHDLAAFHGPRAVNCESHDLSTEERFARLQRGHSQRRGRAEPAFERDPGNLILRASRARCFRHRGSAARDGTVRCSLSTDASLISAGLGLAVIGDGNRHSLPPGGGGI